MKKFVAALIVSLSLGSAYVSAQDSTDAVIAQLQADVKHARLVNDAYYMKIRRWAGDIATYNYCSAHVEDCELVLK